MFYPFQKQESCSCWCCHLLLCESNWKCHGYFFLCGTVVVIHLIAPFFCHIDLVMLRWTHVFNQSVSPMPSLEVCDDFLLSLMLTKLDNSSCSFSSSMLCFTGCFPSLLSPCCDCVGGSSTSDSLPAGCMVTLVCCVSNDGQHNKNN